MNSRIRSDLKFIEEGINNSGYRQYKLIDPISEENYKLSEKAFNIIKFFSKAKSLPDLSDTLNQNNSPGTKEEILEVLSFLKAKNLLIAIPQTPKPGLFSRILKNYLYVLFPLCYPDRFLNNTSFISRLIFAKTTVILATCFSLVGLSLLYRMSDNFMDGIYSSLSIASIKYYIITLIIIKLLHEFSHVYVAKLYNCRVRSVGIALIFLTPRFYSDITDVRDLPPIQRAKVALAGIWSEMIIAGAASYVFLSSELHSPISQVSISLIVISLLSTLLFNGNPFMRFDGYYVLKEILKEPDLNTISNSTLKAFWRKLILGIQPKLKIRLIPLIYGQLSFLYRIFLYTSIVIIIYNFAIKSVGIFLALVEAWVFFIKPLLNELRFAFQSKKLISIWHRFIVVALLGGFLSFLFIELPIPKTAPAHFSSSTINIRTIYPGFIQSINNKRILIENDELNYSIQSLQKDLEFIGLRKRQMIAQKNYTILHLLNSMEVRINASLKEAHSKVKKLTLPINNNTKFYEKPENVIGQYIESGSPVAYEMNDFLVTVYTETSEIAPPRSGIIYFRNEIGGQKCFLQHVNNEPVKYIPAQLSKLHGGPIETTKDYQPYRSLYKHTYTCENKFQKFDTTCTFVWHKNTTLMKELILLLKNFFHSEFI